MIHERTTSMDDGHDHAAAREGFWRKAKSVAGGLPFADDLLAAYYCAFDRDTPLHVKATLIGALGYFVLPADAVSDLLPVLGFTDDAAVLAAAVKVVSDHIKPVHYDAAREKLAEYVTQP